MFQRRWSHRASRGLCSSSDAHSGYPVDHVPAAMLNISDPEGCVPAAITTQGTQQQMQPHSAVAQTGASWVPHTTHAAFSARLGKGCILTFGVSSQWRLELHQTQQRVRISQVKLLEEPVLQNPHCQSISLGLLRPVKM